MAATRIRLGDSLEEVSRGVGPQWSRYRLLGATRGGLALAKEGVGQSPERYKLVEPGTIFYNPMRILLGSIAYLDEGEEPGLTSPDYVIFRATPGVLHPRWFYYWLRSNDGAAFIRTLARGAVRERMLFRRLAEADIDAPTFAGQAAFAKAISVVERARAAAEAQLQAVNGLRSAFLAALFSASKKWPVVSLESVSEIVSGVTLGRRPPVGPTRTVPYLTVANVKDGYLALEDVRSIEVTDSELEKWRLRPGDLLLTEGGDADKLGRGTIWRGEIANCIHQNHIFRVRFRPRVVDQEYAAAQVSSPYGKTYFLRHAKQTTGIATINQRVLRAFPLSCPSLQEQERVVATLRTQLEGAARLQEQAKEQLRALGALPAALLRQAFSREL